MYRCGSENASDVSNVKTLQSTKGKDMATATGKQIERVPNAINLLFLLPHSAPAPPQTQSVSTIYHSPALAARRAFLVNEQDMLCARH